MKHCKNIYPDHTVFTRPGLTSELFSEKSALSKHLNLIRFHMLLHVLLQGTVSICAGWRLSSFSNDEINQSLEQIFLLTKVMEKKILLLLNYWERTCLVWIFWFRMLLWIFSTIFPPFHTCITVWALLHTLPCPKSTGISSCI